MDMIMSLLHSFYCWRRWAEARPWGCWAVCCAASPWGIMWPGTISITSGTIPMGGTAMFALLAMAGDLGGSIGPYMAGLVTQSAGDNLKSGMLAAAVFPVILVAAILLLRRMKRRG